MLAKLRMEEVLLICFKQFVSFCAEIQTNSTVILWKNFTICSLNSANYTKGKLIGLIIANFTSTQEIFTRVPFMTFMTNSTSVWFLRCYDEQCQKNEKGKLWLQSNEGGCGVINKSKGEMICCQRAHWVTTNEWVSSQIDHK